jgi:hypothetical protein
MLKYISLICALTCALAFAAPAAAQTGLTAPITGQVYFTGTTEELFILRAALVHLYSDNRAAFGPQYALPSEGWTSPHNEEATDGPLIPPPWGLGEVDCMTAFYDQLWPNGLAGYLGMSTYVDDVLVTLPTLSEVVLLQPEELPPACKARLVHDWCPWPEVLCGWGDVYCCGL